MGKQRRRDRGSPKGKISWLEEACNFCRKWVYWLFTVLFWGIGDAAQYVKENWSAIQMSMPWYIAAALIGGIGVVLMMRDRAKIKSVDTRQPVPQKEVTK